MITYNTTLFIFRRDLRLIDNSALNAALRSSKQVIASFIFDERQIKPHSYQSKPALHFMLQSLADLAEQFEGINSNLALFQGLPAQVIEQLYQQQNIQAVFINRDYTPFSRQRDAEIAHVCQRLNIALHVMPDALLTEPEQAVKNDGSAYKVFTAFYNNARRFPVALPQALVEGRFLTVNSTTTLVDAVSENSVTTSIQGGRTAALTKLGVLDKCADYAATRDFPALQSTSQLSAHLKFGTVSVREVFYATTQCLGAEHPLLRQLYWRDFLTHIAYHFPSVFGHAFIDKFDRFAWDNNQDYFHAWAEGKTGFPIVDAGMRELNATGGMHNRVRMIVASFLIKDLRISWRWGERYFAQHLVDYDPCLNNGNWQWAASTGCDSQPYFRIFNPWLQQQKFDANGDYIYRWLPELRAVPIKIIHQWDTKYYGDFYPRPIINHSEEVAITKQRFKIMA
ncbi:deoxyribodipyrimidine photolyase [Crenothrix sp. D3]|nr:deoxyribodipyrimidine photolyase [Crenothrix sp. D3]